MKPKTCKQCGTMFEPARQLQSVCGFDCAIAQSRAKRKEAIAKERHKRQQIRQRKDQLKTRSDWAREAQQSFNAFVRIRDAKKPCISCGRPNDGMHQRHASHYRSVKACSALRYNLFNVNASCAQCNSMDSGRIVEYRIALVDKFGSGRVEWLESQNEPVRYSIEYLRRLKRLFNKRTRLYKRLRDAGR